jgi:hypothetical protein
MAMKRVWFALTSKSTEAIGNLSHGNDGLVSGDHSITEYAFHLRPAGEIFVQRLQKRQTTHREILLAFLGGRTFKCLQLSCLS